MAGEGKKEKHYVLHHKSMQDPTLYEEGGEQLTLTEVTGKKRKGIPGEEFLDGGSTIYDVNVLEDDENEELFEGSEVYSCEFGQDFIRELDGFDEEMDTSVREIGEFDFSSKREKSEVDKLFEKEFKEYEYGAVIERDDERAQGPLEVDMFKTALQTFYDETRNYNFTSTDENEGQLFTEESKEEGIFHRDDNGVFLTVLPNKKSRDVVVEYVQGLKESNALVKERIAADPEGHLASDVDTDELFESSEEEDRVDCESVLSTLSNVHNRPTILQRKKLDTKIGRRKVPQPTAAPVDLSDLDQATTLTVSSQRPKGETPEERRERKKLVKEAQRAKRERKKELKGQFKSEELRQRDLITRPNVQQQSVKVPLF